MASSVSLNRPVLGAQAPAIDAVRPLRLPRAPVFGWSSLRREASAPRLASIDALPEHRFTTSGRAALYHALCQLQLPAGATVLVPTYHCPTMVAPILCAGLVPRFFAIGDDGLPALDAIDPVVGSAPDRPRAIIAAHYFGLPKSMAALRHLCDRHGIALIEDCAHSYFGDAGERPIGSWGDFATASVSKFFPVPEAGVLASSRRTLAPLELRPAGTRAQLKGLVDVVELGARYRRFPGLNDGLAALFRWKNRHHARHDTAASIDPSPGEEAMMRGCDMGRLDEAPLWISQRFARHLPRGHIIARRRANFERFLSLFGDAPGARPLVGALPEQSAPYVFPLWVDDADRVYHALRALSAPAFRWDHIWPSAPLLDGDCGPLWSRHVLQLLCHQDLAIDDIDDVARTIHFLLSAP